MKRIFSIIFGVLIIISIFNVNVKAKSDIDHDYIIDTKTNKTVPIPKTHEYTGMIKYIEGYKPESGEEGRLNNPQDIAVDDEDNIYIADTGNNAIVKLDKDGKLIMTVSEVGGDPVLYPLGLYINGKTEEIYFADNGNSRIVHLNKNGEFLEEFRMPETEMLSQNLTAFDPSKIGIVNYTGYIYMLIGKEFLMLDSDGNFKGLVGTEPLGFSLNDLLIRLFATDVQKSKIKKREPVSYNNFCITKDNKIYAVSMASSNQIKKINLSGDNTYLAGTYAERHLDDEGKMRDPFLVDIAVNSREIITVADQNTSKLYQYNDNGELLAVFGGQGSGKGRFEKISAITYTAEDKLLVLDAKENCVQIMSPTLFLQKIHEAVELYLNGEYDAAQLEWKAMLQMIGSYPVAQQSYADILFIKKDYDSALEEYRNAGNKTDYGKVLSAVRSDYISNHFFAVMSVSVLIIAAVLFLAIYMRRYCVWVEEDLYSHNISVSKEFTGLCQLSFFYPVRSWDLLKWRRTSSTSSNGRVNLLPIIILPLFTVLVRYISSRFMAFTTSTISQQNVSIVYEFLFVTVPFITLGLCVYKIGSVFSGEMNLYETLAMLSYSLIPMIIFWPILTAISHIVTSAEAGIFSGAVAMVYIWVALNVIVGIQRINDFSVKKTLGITLLSILGTAIVWVLCVLIYIFGMQLWYFISDVAKEIAWRMR